MTKASLHTNIYTNLDEVHKYVGCLCESIATSILLCGVRYFRSEERKESVLVIPVGSVTAQTELTYEYGVRRNGKKQKTEEKGTWEEL